MSKNNSIWESLTDEQKEMLEEEYRALQAWDNEQRTQKEKELKAQGKWRDYGLDSNQEYFADIIKERNKRFHEIRKKYGFEDAAAKEVP